MKLQGKVTVGISTKDRAEVVYSSIRNMEKVLPRGLKLLVYDDGSTEPVQREKCGVFFDVELFRSEISEGQATGRNALINKCKTPFFLQLDDDSYPFAGDINVVVEAAEKLEDAFAFPLPFEEPSRGREFANYMHVDSIAVQRFVGCSVLIRVDKFKALGGYNAGFIGYAEEDEICLRGFARGFQVYRLGGILIRHDVTVISRSLADIAVKTFRNLPYMWLMHAPSAIMVPRLVKLFLQAIQYSFRFKRPSIFVAFWKGLIAGFSSVSDRSPLSLQNYRKYKNRPEY